VVKVRVESSKKLEGAARLARHRQLVCEHTADAIEAAPARALAVGRDNVQRSVSSFTAAWREILQKGAVPEICALLRDTREGTEQMRISQPFAGLLTTQQLRVISREAEVEPTEHHSLAQVAKRLPHAVICLLSALRFHDLTTQCPHEVWITVDRRPRVPRGLPKLRVFQASGKAMESGIATHVIESVSVRVYDVPKTVADCFRARNKVGTDVAIEALRDAWRQKRCSMDDLCRAAKACRVETVMRPYLVMVATE
jgi:hypothetical protein